MKIQLMGYPGSGKTYLSDRLGERLESPVLHIDEIKFAKDWKQPIEDEKVLPQMAEFMENESWVIDGNYSKLYYNERLEKADMIILLLLPRNICFFSALKRKKEREAQGYINDINPWFIRFLLFGSRTKAHRRHYKEIIDTYGEKVVVLKSRREINAFVEEFNIDDK